MDHRNIFSESFQEQHSKESHKLYSISDLVYLIFTFLVSIGKPKIDNFDAFIFVEKDILRLEIAMRYAKFMEILNAWNQLLENEAGLFLG